MSVLGLFFVGILSLTVIGCSKILPAKFKSQNFSASEVDARAGRLMTQDTINDAQGNTVAYEYAPIDTGVCSNRGTLLGDTLARPAIPISWLVIRSHELTDFVTSAGSTDNQIMNSNFDALVDSLPSLPTDTLLLVKYPSRDTSYAVLKATKAEDIYLYTSLQYYYNSCSGSSNINDYVSVDLMTKDTSSLSSSVAISPENVYNSAETILYANAPRSMAAISARYSLHLDQGGVYIVRFILTNSSEISNPQTTPSQSVYPLISNQFKVVILSSASM